MRRIFKEAAVVGVAAALGLGAGWTSHSSGDSATGAPGKSSGQSSAKSPRVHGPAGSVVSNGAGSAAGHTIDREFLRWLAEASEDELRQAALAGFQNGRGTSRFRLYAILKVLVQKNAQGSYEFFKARDVPRTRLLTAVFEVWSSLDPHAATERVLEYAAERGHASYGGEVSSCFRALGQVDVERALELAATLMPDRRDDAYRGLLQGRGLTTPEDIGRLVSLIEKTGITLKYEITTWASVDADAAIAWLRGEKKGRCNEACYLASGLASADPERAMKLYYEFNALEDGPGYSGVAASVMGQWMKVDYEAAVAWIEGKGTESRREVILNTAFANFAIAAPEGILERLLAGDALAAKYVPWTSPIARLAGKKSEEEMLALLEEAPEEFQPKVREALMAAGFIQATPEELVGIVQGTENGGFGGATRAMLARNPELFGEFVAQLEGEQRASFIKQMGGSVANDRPELMLGVLEDQGDPSLFEGSSAQHAVAYLARSRPEAAMRAVERFPEGKAREYGAQTLMANLQGDDPDAALAWLNEQRESLPGETIWSIASRARSTSGVSNERIEEMFGDLDPSKKKEGEPGGDAGARGGAIIGGSIGN